MTMTDMMNRLGQIDREIQTARASALRFYDDPCEVAHWHAVIDELVLERKLLERRLDEELDAATLDYAIRLATHTDREM